jgi:cytoskeletal protein RodZ
MKLPQWVAPAVFGVIFAVLGFFGKWSWDAHAQMTTQQANYTALNDKVNANKEFANSDIRALKEIMIEFKTENKEDHKEIKMMIRRGRDR